MQKKLRTSGILTAVCEADDMLKVLNLNPDDLPENALSVTDLKTKLTKWASKSLHGRYPRQLNQPGIDKYATHI
jgi:hypothetical protein